MATIIETGVITASDNDVLDAPSRLSSLPFGGMLTLEISASAAATANHCDLTVELPDGSLPIEGQIIPAGATAGALDDRTEMVLQFPVASQLVGGHVLMVLTVTGTCTVTWRATLVSD